MAWIELHQQLPTHPKTKRLTRALGLTVPKDIPEVVGHLCMFWLWCIDYATDGSLDRMTEQDIADAAGWTGDPEKFLDSMRQAGFIDVDEDGVSIVHDWDDYIGRLLAFRDKERKRNREKQTRHRERVKQQKQEDGEEAPPPSEEPAKDPFDISDIDPEWLKVVKCYEANIGLIPCGTSGDLLLSYFNDLGAELVCKAIEITNTANPENPWKYLRAVLNKWVEQKIDTPEKADAYTKDLERRLKKHRSGQRDEGTTEPPAISGNFY